MVSYAGIWGTVRRAWRRQGAGRAVLVRRGLRAPLTSPAQHVLVAHPCVGTDVCSQVVRACWPPQCSPDRALLLQGANTRRSNPAELLPLLQVCWDYFGDESATVACRQLGFLGGRGTRVFSDSPFVREPKYGPGSGPILLDDVLCDGTEASIGDCRHRGWGVHNCEHAYDVSIQCFDGPSEHGLPVGGSSRLEAKSAACGVGWGF